MKPVSLKEFPISKTLIPFLLSIVLAACGSTTAATSTSTQPHSTSTASIHHSPGSLYQGDGYTITPLAGWQVQPNPFGVAFSDPRFPMASGRDASQLGVANNDPLFLQYGSSFRLRCRRVGGVPATATLAGAVWGQFQYNCAPLQQGGVASLFRVLFTTHGAAHKYFAIYYLAAVDRLSDFSDGSFATMAQTFTFS